MNNSYNNEDITNNTGYLLNHCCNTCGEDITNNTGYLGIRNGTYYLEGTCCNSGTHNFILDLNKYEKYIKVRNKIALKNNNKSEIFQSHKILCALHGISTQELGDENYASM